MCGEKENLPLKTGYKTVAMTNFKTIVTIKPRVSMNTLPAYMPICTHWTRTQYIDQADLNRPEICLPLPQVLELTIPGPLLNFLFVCILGIQIQVLRPAQEVLVPTKPYFQVQSNLFNIKF